MLLRTRITNMPLTLFFTGTMLLGWCGQQLTAEYAVRVAMDERNMYSKARAGCLDCMHKMDDVWQLGRKGKAGGSDHGYAM